MDHPASATSAAARGEDTGQGRSTFRRIAARIPTYVADFREKPAWLPMFVLGRTMLVRRLHWRGAKPTLGSSSGETLFGGIDPDEAVRSLRSGGLHPAIVLPPDVHEEIADFARKTACFGNFDREIEFLPEDHEETQKRLGRGILSAHYFERTLECDAVVAVQRDPLLRDVAARYLGAQTRIIRTRLWWTFPTVSARESDKGLASLDRYHFDLDDWRMLKFFFYLTPVDEEAGPHVYVMGSHRRRRLRHQLTLLVGHPSAEVVGFYGADKVVTITGPAGYGFVEDPFGFHMGTLPLRQPRLMLEVGFGVSRPVTRDLHGEPVLANAE